MCAWWTPLFLLADSCFAYPQCMEKTLAFSLVALLRMFVWDLLIFGVFMVLDFFCMLFQQWILLTNLQNKLIYQSFLIFVILKYWTNISERSHPSFHAKYVYVQDKDFLCLNVEMEPKVLDAFSFLSNLFLFILPYLLQFWWNIQVGLLATYKRCALLTESWITFYFIWKKTWFQANELLIVAQRILFRWRQVGPKRKRT